MYIYGKMIIFARSFSATTDGAVLKRLAYNGWAYNGRALKRRA